MTRSVYTLCGFEKNKPVGFCVFCEFCGNYDKGTITRRIITKGMHPKAKRPVKAKALIMNAFALTGRIIYNVRLPRAFLLRQAAEPSGPGLGEIWAFSPHCLSFDTPSFLYKSFVVVDVYRSPNGRLYLITMFTIFFGTTITLTTFLSPMYLALCSSASTASWMASLVASAGNFFWKRALPLKDMVS